jgi:hypothetical protein
VPIVALSIRSGVLHLRNARPLDLRNANEADLRYAESAIRFSICTLVTDKDQYAAMVQSFRSGGFDQDDCEFLYLDNSAANRFDAYQGINIFLQAAKGQHIVICHQDIALLQDGRPKREAAIQRLDGVDPNWAVFGNAGAQEGGAYAIHITDPEGCRTVGGPFPVKVQSLDEVFSSSGAPPTSPFRAACPVSTFTD